MRKRLTVSSIIAGSALLFATACGTSTGNSSNASTSASKVDPQKLVSEGLPAYNSDITKQGNITLRVLLAQDWVNQKPIKDLLSEFHSVYPNVTIQATGAVWEDIPNKVKVEVAGGDPPDLVHQNPYAMGAMGYAENLDSQWKQWGQVDKFIPSALSEAKWNNHFYGVPIELNCTFTFYNKSLFNAAGIGTPTGNSNFTDIMNWSKKLVSSHQSTYGVSLSAGTWDTYGLIRANGGDLIKVDNGQVVPDLNNPKIVQVLTWIQKMSQQKLTSQPPQQARQSDTPVAMYASKQIGMFFSGPWDLSGLQQNSSDLYSQTGTLPLPSGVDGHTNGSVMGGSGLFIPKGAKYPEVAFELSKWFVSQKYSMEFAQQMGRFPTETAEFNKTTESNPMLNAFVTQLKTASVYPLAGYPQLDQLFQDAIRQAFTSNANMQQVLNDAQKKALQVMN